MCKVGIFTFHPKWRRIRSSLFWAQIVGYIKGCLLKTMTLCIYLCVYGCLSVYHKDIWAMCYSLWWVWLFFSSSILVVIYYSCVPLNRFCSPHNLSFSPCICLAAVCLTPLNSFSLWKLLGFQTKLSFLDEPALCHKLCRTTAEVTKAWDEVKCRKSGGEP